MNIERSVYIYTLAMEMSNDLRAYIYARRAKGLIKIISGTSSWKQEQFHEYEEHKSAVLNDMKL